MAERWLLWAVSGFSGMILVLRLLDAFQHTYEVFPVGTPLPKLDHAYEHANTFGVA